MKTILLFSLLFTALTFGNTFKHKFEHALKAYPNCHVQASELEAKFRTTTGNSSGEVACTRDDGHLASFELTYTAENPLHFVNSEQISPYSHGMYAKEDECTAELADELSRFESATGLKSFLTYCQYTDYLEKAPWTLVHTAFGTPTKAPQTGGFLYFTYPENLDLVVLTQTVEQALQRRGALLRKIIPERAIGFNQVAIYYYGERVKFEMVELFNKGKKDDCLADLPRFQSSMQNNAIESLYTMCGVYSLGGWRLSSLFLEPLPVTLRPSVETFKSHANCEADRLRLVEYYRTKIDVKVVDGFCHYDDEDHAFKVRLIKK